MDVRLEDGTVVTNVPEGITQSELLARVGKTKQPKAQSDPLRDIALTGRAAVEGAVGLPSMAADAFSGNLAKRLMFGNDAAPPTLSDTLKGFLDKHSYTPETEGERLAADVVGGGVGALGVGGPIKNAVGVVVPGMVAGGATGAARESGASPLWQLLAGLVGGVTTTGAMEGIKSAGRGVKNVVDSAVVPGGSKRAAGRILDEAAGANKPQVVKALENATSDIPGMKLNAGQAAAKAGSAEFSGLQKIAAETKPTPYAALEASQEEARKAALGTVGQTKEALSSAIGKRAANARQNYAAAFEQSVKADPELAQIASNPYFKDALPDAFKEAAAKGINPKTDMTEFLHVVKLSLSGELEKTGDNALKRLQKTSVQDVKSQLVDWLAKKNPNYESARAQFSADSKPINQMQVGQYLQDKLASPLEGAERSASFAQATRDAAGTIKRSSGQSMYDELGQVLTPQQEGTVNSVLNNLKNETTFKDLASKGMPAARRIVGQSADPIPQVNMLNRAMMVTNAIVRRLEGKGGRAAIESMADIMQDPQKAAAVLKAATPVERATLIEALSRSAAGSMGAQQ